MKSRISAVSFALLVLLFALFSGSAKAANAVHEVKKGESLSLIASLHKVPGGWQAIFRQNAGLVKNPNLIQPGWKLKFSGPSSVGLSPEAAPAGAKPEGGAEQAVPNVNPNPKLPLPKTMPDSRRVEEPASLAPSSAGAALLPAEPVRKAVKAAVLPSPVAHSEISVWAIVASGFLLLSVFLNLFLFCFLFRQWRKEKKAQEDLLALLKRTKEENSFRLEEIREIKSGLASEPLEEILSDRESLREDEGLPPEDRNVLLQAVLGYHYGNPVEDRKPALRDFLRSSFPDGKAFYRGEGKDALIPLSRGEFKFTKDGGIKVSLYGLLSDGKEAELGNLNSLFKNRPDLWEGLSSSGSALGNVPKAESNLIPIKEREKNYRDFVEKHKGCLGVLSDVPKFQS